MVLLQECIICIRKNIIHRDLKPQNILLFGTKLEMQSSSPTFLKLEAKIGDVGISKREAIGEEESLSANRWTAPEVITGRYSTPADIYSFALIVWFYWTGKQPFEGAKQLPPQNGLRPAIPPSCPKKWANLIERCWHQEPTKRPPFSEIMHILNKI